MSASMTTHIQFAIDFLSLGGAYALMALGLVIIYGILRLVNFAYGDLVMVTGYSLFLFAPSPLPWLFMAFCAVLMAMLFAVLTDFAAFRPLRARSVTAVLITSFAFSNLLQNLSLLFISPRPRTVPLPDWFSDTLNLAGALVPLRDLVAIGASAVLLGALALLMRKTALGLAMRAAATNFNMARMLGVPANLVITTAFALSGLLAGVAGILWLGRTGTVSPVIGLEPLLVAFIATVIGGMHSLSGAVIGGFLLAFINTRLNYDLSAELLKFRDAFSFSLVILILLIRPQGLIQGAPDGERT